MSPVDPFDVADDDLEEDDFAGGQDRDESETVASIADDSGILDAIERFICDASDILGWDNDRAKREIRKIMDESF